MNSLRGCLVLTSYLLLPARVYAAPTPIAVGTFPQEIRVEHHTADGLPTEDVLSVVVLDGQRTFAGTSDGLAEWRENRWQVLPGTAGKAVRALAAGAGKLWFERDGAISELQGNQAKALGQLPRELKVHSIAANDRAVFVATDQGLWQLAGQKLEPVAPLNSLLGERKDVYQVALGESVAVGAAGGLFRAESNSQWTRLLPADDRGRSWAPVNVRGAAFDSKGRLWFASPQGVGRFDGKWTLFTGAEGLPWNGFTTMTAAEDGAVWFGTSKGAIKYDGDHWGYRQGRRWLPDDDVRAISVAPEGHAWFATSHGLGRIERRPMTLAKKAEFYENQIDALHRRTPWEYVLEVTLAEPGVTNQFRQHDSDNDGLWTSMYGAGECFAYGATKSPLAKTRAKKAFEALRWLGEVSQGGSHPAPKGFVARSILPTSGPDPNPGPQSDKSFRKERDRLWKVYEPRWPKSADGKWYWKSDTSSDELDGHFFFYALYYDLVAETPEEKSRVREHVRALMDHLVEHDFTLVDHSGTATRWGMFNPKVLNRDPLWADDRGLNSLSLLSYLAATAHVTGDAKYEELIRKICTEEYYDMNLHVPKTQRGVGSGNHSDDEMAFMGFYNLVKYSKDPKLRAMAGYAWFSYWILEFPEMNPFFNFAYATFGLTFKYENAFASRSLPPWPGWLEDSLDTLKRFPLDRFDWQQDNRHRLDLIPLVRQTNDPYGRRGGGFGYRVNGKVIPVDERFFNHWNHNPFALLNDGNGQTLADGAVFLLPYYMGLYHGFIE